MNPFKISAVTAQHIGDRAEQQDRMLIHKHPRHAGYILAVVADGMGGRTGGGIAAEQVVKTTAQLFDNFQLNETVPDLLTQSAYESHALIKILSLSESKEPHSTMVALVITPNRIHWVHVGDSRLYRFRGGVVKTITVDHSFVLDAIALGKMTPEQAKVHPNRNMLTSALGMATEPKCTVGGDISPTPGDVYLLASDGLWGYFEAEEMAQILNTMSIKTAMSLMIELARERGAGRGDNISVIIVKIHSLDNPETVYG